MVPEFGSLIVLLLGLFTGYQFTYRYSSMTYVLFAMLALIAFSTIAILLPSIKAFRPRTDDRRLYDSPRWENYLDAQEDYEYLWLANRSIAWLRANSSVYSSAQLDAFQAALDSAVSSVASDRDVHTQHPAAIYQARATIAAMLEQFASSVDLLSLGEEQWWPVG